MRLSMPESMAVYSLATKPFSMVATMQKGFMSTEACMVSIQGDFQMSP